MSKSKWLGLIIFLTLVVGGFFIFKKGHAPATSINIPNAPAIQPEVLNGSPTPTSSAAPVARKVLNTPEAPALSVATRGQITCDYQYPPSPNAYGDVKIESNWNSANVNICVSANGSSQTLMASDSRNNGSRVDDASWIALNVNYQFILYSHSSNDPICSGTVLSSCNVGTSVPSPQSGRPGR